MRQVLIRTYCDRCWKDNEQLVEAIFEDTITSGSTTRLLADCGEHEAVSFGDMEKFLIDYGSLPEAPVPRGQRTITPRERIPCPKCELSYANRGSLADHLRRQHDTSIVREAIPLPDGSSARTRGPEEPKHCPACDVVAKTGGGMAAHIRARHGVAALEQWRANR